MKAARSPPRSEPAIFRDHRHIASEPAPLCSRTGTDFIMRATDGTRRGPAMNATLNLSAQTTTARGRRDDYRADTKAIMLAIRDADRRMRERFPVLRHQTALGMGFMGFGYTAAAVSAWLFIDGLIPAWACIVINAMAFDVLREIQ